MTAGPVHPRFLRDADEAGWALDVAGHLCVAGAYEDPVTGEQQVLAEYVDPALLALPGGPDTVLRALASVAPGATSSLIRVPGDQPAVPGWAPMLSYVRYDAGLPETATAEGGIDVAEAAPGEETELIGEWLARALHHAAGERRTGADDDSVRDQVAQMLASPDRITLLARRDGVVVGHATMLRDAYDAPTDSHLIELFDILIDSDADRSTATRCLVAGAARLADRLQKPLVGNVVHARDAQEPGGGRVLGSLLSHGWTLSHRYLWAPLPASDDAPRSDDDA